MDNIIKAAKKKRQKRNYFTQETEDAIVKYNKSSDKKFKSLITSSYSVANQKFLVLPG